MAARRRQTPSTVVAHEVLLSAVGPCSAWSRGLALSK